MLEFDTFKAPTPEEMSEELKRLQNESDAVASKAVESVEETVAETTASLPTIEQKQDIAPTVSTKFGEAMEGVKLNVLSEAGAEDKEFVDKVKKTLKSAAVKNTEIEEKKADFEKQKVDFASEVLSTEQQKNTHRAIEDKWANREKRRRYHYNGVKPIMMFVDITEPLNLFLLYTLTVLLAPFFLLSKFLKGTIGALIAGASDSDRPKAVKGFLWTLLGVFTLLVIAVLVYLFLEWRGLV